MEDLGGAGLIGVLGVGGSLWGFRGGFMGDLGGFYRGCWGGSYGESQLGRE